MKSNISIPELGFKINTSLPPTTATLPRLRQGTSCEGRAIKRRRLLKGEYTITIFSV
ncbi:hypothetical protein [Fodinibius sp. AD559]|uniref:hypothetical protein n=1 Tax=Fodinibius sp. AD559 TaxID=3424179 RepID=UPI004046CC5D